MGLGAGGGGRPVVLLPLPFLGRYLWTCFLPILGAMGCSPPFRSLSRTLFGRFDSNASASSSSNEGDSDRDEKKRKQLKKAKMAKDRKSRKKPMEVHTHL